MDQRLNGWKAIASYLGRDERTAKRWEAQRHLPVHRVPGGGGGSVFGVAGELDAWLAGPSAAVPAAARPSRRWPDHRVWLPVALAIIVLFAVTALAWPTGPRPNGRPASARAADFYFAGLHALNSRTPTGIAQAIDNFDATLKIEPRFAPAWVGLADSYNLIREFGSMPDAQAYPKAEKAARTALAIDPANAGAHRALAFILFNFHDDAPAAEREFGKALTLDPDAARTHHWWATTLLAMGRPEEAMREIDRARALDPEATAIQSDRALILAQLGQMAAARAELARLAALDPTTPGPPRWGARLALFDHDGAAFVALGRTAAALRGDPVDSAINQAAARGWAAGGWRGLLDQASAEVELLHQTRRVDDYPRAEFAAVSGDTARAAALLRTIIARHEPGAGSILGTPVFAETLRRDPALVGMARGAIGIPASGG